MNQEFQQMLKEKDLLQAIDEVPRVQVRLHNLKVVKRMRDMDPEDIDSLVAIRGMVIRTTSVIPDMRKAYFRCASCGDGVEVVIDRGRVNEPTVCGKCSKRHSMVLIHNRCTFKDKQLIKLQETPESIPEVCAPRRVLCVTAIASLCRCVRAG